MSPLEGFYFTLLIILCAGNFPDDFTWKERMAGVVFLTLTAIVWFGGGFYLGAFK